MEEISIDGFEIPVGSEHNDDSEEKLVQSTLTIFRVPSSKELKVKPLLSFSPKMVARQMSIIALELYNKISIEEIQFLRWKKEDKDIVAPNLTKFISWFNTCSNWIKTVILTTEKTSERILMLEFIIVTANIALKFHNLYFFSAIVFSLCDTPISRLRNTWKLLGKNERKLWRKISVVCDNSSNWSTLRNLMMFDGVDPKPPCVPYIGILLQDILMLDEIPLKKDGYYNFKRLRKTAKVLEYVLQFKSPLYDCEVSPGFMLYYNNRVIISSEDEFYKLSYEREPRERKRSKI
eukprot:TRINITY_DN7363_c1_g2_i1.p1 TRINITY_DN7363_c1_g2~~TRINITY_DN7363_c1_g2_i1.p1  ORF type:complete len:292 (+),score=59.45 TRINITY_DN7363_c1_g2_i1:51-926(+)